MKGDPKSPYRLGFIIGSMLRGGTETHLSELLPELCARGYRVSLMVIGPVSPLAKDLVRKGIHLQVHDCAWAPKWAPAWIRRFLRAAFLMPSIVCFGLRHHRGVIHLFFPQTIILCGLL